MLFLDALSLGTVLHKGRLAGSYGRLVWENLAVLGIDQDHFFGATSRVLLGQLGRIVGSDNREVGDRVLQPKVDPSRFGNPLADPDEPVVVLV